MNKEEIEQGLVRARVAETTIKNNIIKLLEQLVESEKPKLRQGDFGVTTRDSCDKFNKFIVIKTPKGELEPQYQDGLTDGSSYAKKHFEEYIIFGNIFGLMKKDLWYFKFDVHEYKINTKEFPHAPIHIAGNWHTLAEAEEIWRKLGQMIMTLKRKENK